MALFRGRIEVCDHRLADTVVVRLDHIQFRGPGYPDQPAGAQDGKRLAIVRHHVGGLACVRLAERSPGNGDDFEQPPRLVRQAHDAGHEHTVERKFLAWCRSARGLVADLHVTHQFDHEKRASTGLTGDRGGVSARAGIFVAQEPCGERFRLGRGQVKDGELATVDGLCAIRPAGQEVFEEWATVGVLRAVTPYQEDDGRIRRSQDLGQERRAIAVAPLQIIDRQHQRPAVSQPGE